MGRRTARIQRLLERIGLEFRRPGAAPGGRWLPYRSPDPVLPAVAQPSGSTLTREAISVPVEHVTASPGFSYRTDGWHPYVTTLQQHVADPGLRYEDSALHVTFKRFIPANAQQALLEDVERPLAPLHRLPPRVAGHEWLLTRREVDRVLRGRTPRWMRHGKRLFGPIEPAAAHAEFERLIGVYRSVRDLGLQSEISTDPIRGYFLVRGEDYRFVLTGGQHRVAALRVLGEESVPVRLDWLRAVREDELLRWTVAQDGPYPVAVAQQIFDKLFHESGQTKARNLGLA